MYKQNWYSHINNSMRILFYSNFTHEFVRKIFLRNKKDVHKITMTKFRISVHNL